MTIKNITLSVIATSFVATTAMAGTITNTGTVGLVGQEKLSLGDLNVSNAFGTSGATTAPSIVYTPKDIPATSLKNPIFKYTFGNATALVLDTNASVWEGPSDGNDSNGTLTNWRRVAGNMQVSGTNSEIASFNAADSTIYVYNNKKYIVSGDNGTVLTSGISKIAVKKASTASLTLTAQLYSGDSQAQADTSAATVIAKVGPEFTGSITTKFNAQIDASKSFYSFYNQTATGETATKDIAIFSLKQNATLAGASLGVTAATLVVSFDQNLTKNAYATSGTLDTVSSTTGGAGAAGTYSDYNDSIALTSVFNAANTAADNNVTVTLGVDGVSEIQKTSFDARAYVTSGTNFNLITQTTGNAGAWTIYGYNAQIPNVAATSSVDVTMKFTNRSGIKADIYFTLIDPDGTIATVNSVTNTTLASLPANTTGTYKASALLALITDTNFDKTGSFSVEVSIPTTPSSVYGMASFKNLTLGQFKDLPVYNTSTYAY